MGDYTPPSIDAKPCPLPTPKSSASFWHSEPAEDLMGFKSSDAVPESADVVVVGCGITGASAARCLTEQDPALDVVVLEAREVCWGATGRNGGHLQPLLFDRTSEIASFELDNCAEVAKYISENDVQCEYRQVDGCRTFWTKDLLKEAKSHVDALHKESPEIGKFVSIVTEPTELATHKVLPSCPGVTLSRGAGSLWPYKLVTFIIRKLLAEKKIKLYTHTPVTSLTGNPKNYSLQTPNGTIKTRHVLLATNAYTSHLLPSFAPHIVPVRGTMSALLPPPNSTILPNSYGFVGAGPGANPNADDYLIQRPFSGVPNPTGHLMFGGGRTAGLLEAIGETDDAVVDKGSVSYLQKILLETLDLGEGAKGMEELEVDQAWSGIMGYSRDNAPWVGGVPGMEGVWLCAGYTGHGMPNATLCARAAVELLLANESGKHLASVQKEMVEQGRLPSAYLISTDRLAECNGLPSVKEQDETISMGYVAGKWSVQGKFREKI
ncbi:gb [Venturia nashicola]|uniref:Gb n=1 Tax=Venturia nashicola TaxID=86259 RepID=A0A4Z1P6C9_9PEZI|nr:gb [Venturia nashicola]